jgi:hypothetical protein
MKDSIITAVSPEMLRLGFVTYSNLFTALQKTLYWAESALLNSFHLSLGSSSFVHLSA